MPESKAAQNADTAATVDGWAWRTLSTKLEACMRGFLKYGTEDWRQACQSALADFDALNATHLSQYDGTGAPNA
jgi:hypothetical protein